MKNGVLSNFTRSHISNDRVRSGYEINCKQDSASSAIFFYTRTRMLHAQHAFLVLDFYELDCDWLKKWRNENRFAARFRRRFSGGEKRQPEIRLRSQARLNSACGQYTLRKDIDQNTRLSVLYPLQHFKLTNDQTLVGFSRQLTILF